jgi:large-conductance mechanosensitive channel
MSKDEASLWWESRNSQVQDYVNPEEFEKSDETSFIDIDNVDTEVEEEKELISNKERISQLNMIKLSEPTAEIVTSVINSLVPLLLVLLIKNSNSENYKLTPDEHQTLVNAWANYLKDSNVQVSPGILLIVSIASIYGAKITTAVAERKKEEKIHNELQLQIDEIKQNLESKSNEKSNTKK